MLAAAEVPGLVSEIAPMVSPLTNPENVKAVGIKTLPKGFTASATVMISPTGKTNK